ncbi:MAG: hypothetical protein KAH03_01825 [Cocleimonas sp.]|nr:hypothetical protein [Cocleimonas sp.]
MFILDLSGSMLWDLNSNTAPADSSTERLAVMKTALNQVLSDPDLKNINIGLMGFSGISSSAKNVAHGPTFPVVDVESPSFDSLFSNINFNPSDKDSASYLSVASQWNILAAKFGWDISKKDSWIAKKKAKFAIGKSGKKKATSDQINAKEYIQLASSTWGATGGTPIVDAFYEAALYFRGENVDYGKYLPSDHRSAHPASYEGEIKLEELTPKEVCTNKTCYGDDCNDTKICTPYAAGTYRNRCYNVTETQCLSSHPTWSNCSYHTYNSCSNSCPDEEYNEFGSCLNPLQTCVGKYYYECDVPYDAGTNCKHDVCETVIDTVVTGEPTYLTPVKEECQSNTLILMSDGMPSLNKTADEDKIKNIVPDAYRNNCRDNGSKPAISDPASQQIEYYGRCGGELASFLHKEDQSTGTSGLAGKQTIETSTIGFALNGNVEAADYLKLLSKNGGGEFYNANDLASLTASFKDALTGGSKKARLFTSPSFTVAPSKLLEHKDEVFLPVFNHKSTPLWSGNLKKFKLKDGEIVDINDVPATDDNGTLRTESRDEWAVAIPEHAVEDGGAASLLDPANRNLLTNTAGVLLQTLNATNATKTLLGDAAMEDDTQTALLRFIQGYEKDATTPRHHIGDIIHSKPVVISYSAKRRVFIGSNEGFLHSFDADSGEEKFAFMPKSLLKNIAHQYKNLSTDKHLSGVDGEITSWIQDDNHNGQWDDGENVTLFFGLRRGGNAYYALDVSNPDADPKLLWKIDDSMPNFSELGQTWSTPVLTQLRYGGDASLRPVLIFGGGYNERIDNEDTATRPAAATNNSGTSVYIVNALTGALIWQADSANTVMKYAVPGRIRALDMDRNGSVDRLYFGDMGGNIWRVDLNASDFDSPPSMHDISKAKLSQLAELGDNAGSDLRKFFYEPDVAFFRHEGRFLLTVAIGSGYRSHPLNENIVNRFFVLRDQYVLRMPDGSFKTITETDLKPAPLDSAEKLLDNNYYGWYRELNTIQNEKVLATATTFMNRVIFTTFGKTAPVAVVEGSCDTVTNFQSRGYVIDLLRGGAVIDFDETTGNDVSIKISNDEIVATPQIIFGKIRSSSGTDCVKNDCSQTISMRVGKKNTPFVDTSTTGGNVDITTLLPKVFWREEEK